MSDEEVHIPGSSLPVRRRRRHADDSPADGTAPGQPQREHGELAVYAGSPTAPAVAPTQTPAAVGHTISAGRRFMHPHEEFERWEDIKAEVFKEFVHRSGLPDSTPDKVKETQAYAELVNHVAITLHPEWGVQPIQLERLIELLRIYQFGYGPLEDYMNMDGLEELYFNRYDRGFYIVRGDKHRISEPVFADEAALVQFVQHVARENGLEINTEKPNLDATLKDGSRLNATLEPLAYDGPDFVMRKHRDIPFTIEQYIASGMLTAELAADLKHWVEIGMNIVVSGGTGSGKTSLLNCLGNTFIPKDERVLILENRKELQIYTEDTKYFQTKEDATRESRDGDVSMKDLIRYCLRKRPDRIVVGEVRGSEAYYALVAWNSGHDGSFCTVHADNAASAVDKLEQLAMETGRLSEASVRKLISRSVDIVVQVERLKGEGGRRRITEVGQIFHPRKYNRRDRAVAERVAKLSQDKETGIYALADNLWVVPLYELDGTGALVKLNDYIPVQGKS